MLMSLSWPSSRAHKLLLCFICLCCHFDSRKYACVRSQATFFSAWVSCEDSRLSCFPLLEKKKTQKNLWDQGRLKVSENQKTVIFTSEFLFCKLSACFSQDVFCHTTGCVIREQLVTLVASYVKPLSRHPHEVFVFFDYKGTVAPSTLAVCSWYHAL